MQKRRIILPVTILMTLGLAACGANDEAGGGNSAMPIGYYSNEKHEENGGNSNWLNEDNDGPVTEMLDHFISGEGNQNRLRGINNEAAPGGEYNDTLHSRSDRNYHGHLNENDGGARNSYHTAYDGDLVKKVNRSAQTVVNVADARAVIHEDHVIIGVVLEDPTREQETKEKIRDVVDTHLRGKELTIVTNDSIFSQIRTIDNGLREGYPKEEINDFIEGLFRTVGNQTR